MSLVFCTPQPILIGQLKRALSLVDVEFVDEIEHCPSKNWYFTTDFAKCDQVENPKTIVFIGNLLFTAPLSDNEYHVTSAEMLSDLVPLTVEECRRLDRLVFNPNSMTLAEYRQRNPIQELVSRLHDEGFLNQLFQQHQQADPPKRKLPVEWNERLRTDTVERAADDDDACIICAEGNKRTILFIPCDHCCSCEVCAKRMMETSGNCPICRELITDVRRIKR